MLTLTTSRKIVLLETLGSGGFGAVYLADLQGPDGFSQRVAVKILHEAHARRSDLAARQRDEARLLARLNHDQIVKVLDLTEVDGRPAVIMEYVEGVDAAHLVGLGPLPPRAALEIAAGAASALNAAVETLHPDTGRPLRVVHRDIKPANLLVTVSGGMKVLDFGVARAELEREGKTKSVAFGTARYMAPEAWIGGDVSPAVDIYALGVTLSELLLGRDLDRAPLREASHAAWRAALQTEVRAGMGTGVGLDWVQSVLALLERTITYEPEDRLSAGAFYERAWELAETAPGEGLRRFARRVVPAGLEARRAEAAPLPSLASNNVAVEAAPTPTLVAETTAPSGPTPPAATPPMETAAWAQNLPVPTARRVSAAEAGVEPSQPGEASAPPSVVSEIHGMAPVKRSVSRLAGAGVLLSTAAFAAGIALWSNRPGPESPSADLPVATAPSEAAPDPSADAPSTPTPEKVLPATPQPKVRASTSPPIATSPPSQPATSQSAPAETDPASAPVRCAEAAGPGLVAVRLSSDPLGAEVLLDGTTVGTTPLLPCLLPEGRYALTMKAGDGHTSQRTLTVARRSPPGTLWRVEEDKWEALY